MDIVFQLRATEISISLSIMKRLMKKIIDNFQFKKLITILIKIIFKVDLKMNLLILWRKEIKLKINYQQKYKMIKIIIWANLKITNNNNSNNLKK